MAYLCTTCVWCPQRLGERVESPGTKVTNGCKSLCGCWVLFVVVVVVSWDRVSL